MEKNNINIAEILRDCPKKLRWDPVGMNIGSLKVLREVEHVRHPNGKTSRRFECLCKCGNYTYVLADNLKRRANITCGHCGRANYEYEIIPGAKYGKLTILKEIQSKKDYLSRRVRMVECKCECGNTHITSFRNLRYGICRSCGCLSKETVIKRSTKHGLSHKHPLYGVWKGIKERCKCQTNRAYSDYGGRGITVCEQWDKNFKEFFDWSLANGWKEGLSIDRIDNNKGYNPENCRFVNSVIQARNKRNNHPVVHDGKEWHCLSQFCEDMGLDYKIVQQRLYRGMSLEKAINFVYNEHTAHLLGTTNSYTEGGSK